MLELEEVVLGCWLCLWGWEGGLGCGDGGGGGGVGELDFASVEVMGVGGDEGWVDVLWCERVFGDLGGVEGVPLGGFEGVGVGVDEVLA